MTDDGQAIRDQGIEAFRDGRTDDAIRLLSQAVSDDPRDHRAYAVLGAAHMQRGDQEQAIAAFESARHLRPDAAHIHYNLGLAYQRAGRADDAVRAFQGALEVDPAYEKAKEALSRAQAAARGPARPSGLPTAPPPSDHAPPGPARMPTVPPTPRAASPTEDKAPAGPPPVPPQPSEAPPGPARMPSVPPAAPAASGPPKAPWDTDSSTGPAKPAEDTFQLRRLGGGQEPAQAQKQPSATSESEGPPRAPWEMEGNQAQRIQRPVDRRPKEEPPPRRSDAGQIRRPGYAPRGAKKATQGQYAAAGALGGALYGAIFMVILMVVDRFLGSQWGVVAKAGKPGWVPLIIGAAITGAIFGAIIGIPTAVSANTAPGIYTGVGLWVFVTIILLLREGVTGAPLLLGLAMGGVYGVLMGWVVASQTNSSIKRE